MTQLPSIGRIVHFHQYHNSGVFCPDAAIVVGVYEDGKIVDLVVFRSDGVSHENCVIYSEIPELGHWSWPPRV
jgi:hypothetical protein